MLLPRGVEHVDARLCGARTASTPSVARRVHSMPRPTALPLALPSISPAPNENGTSSSVLSLRLCSKLRSPARRARPFEERLGHRGAERFDAARDVDRGERFLDDVGVLIGCDEVERDAARRQRHVVRNGVVARAVGAAEMAAQRIAVAHEAVVRERDARMVLADGRGAIVGRDQVDLERPPLRDPHAQHALAERRTGLELRVDALDERVVLQIA